MYYFSPFQYRNLIWCIQNQCKLSFLYFHLFSYVKHGVKRPTLDEIRLENKFISGGNPHLTSRFGKAWVRPNPNSKMVLKPILNLLGNLLSGFRYRTTRVTLQMSCHGHEGCVKSPTLDVIRLGLTTRCLLLPCMFLLVWSIG